MVKKILLLFVIVYLSFFFVVGIWEIYLPNLTHQKSVVYVVKKGAGLSDIAADLEKNNLIKSRFFFELYAVLSQKRSKIQAGSYEISPSMSIAQIVQKIAAGDIIKQKITIVEGWTINDVAQYLGSKKNFSQKDFLSLASSSKAKDWSKEFNFLKDKPKNLNLEGYIFPDTYFIPLEGKQEDLIAGVLANFDKKLNLQLRLEILAKKRSVFEIITMASLLEKEVKSFEDKKIVAGILWKRLANNVPLQVDATVNFITNKNSPKSFFVDTSIDSPYNTYRYTGLPLGPICNPGMESILAAIYPQDSLYWYYLSSNYDHGTIFSKTLQEHNLAIRKYLNY